jgi:nucleoid DNA-binding protein
MATKKKAAKPAAKASSKPISETLSKSGLVKFLAERAQVEMKHARAVLEALEEAISASIHKKGAKQFTLPGLLKITSVAVPAKPRRFGVDPFTKQERWFEAKPASVRVKVRALRKLKDAAA